MALIIAVIGAVLCTFALMPKAPLQENIERLFETGMITKVLALGALPNAFVFHLLIKKNQFYMARGVVMGVFVITIGFIIYKFI